MYISCLFFPLFLSPAHLETNLLLTTLGQGVVVETRGAVGLVSFFLMGIQK